MRNTYSPWDELAQQPDLRLEWALLVGRVGEYLHVARKIVLDPRMPKRQARSILCHELRHAEVGDEHTACDRVNLRQEQRADREAARLLVDIRDLGDALVLHEQHISAAAVELRVSDAMLRTRLRGLHPSERWHLTERLSAAGLRSA